jgi:DHA1 family inner membrane transport protein
MATTRFPLSACSQKLRVSLLMASGVVAAAQVGKAIISMPLIRAEMGLGLDLAGLIVAISATLGACLGIVAGVFVQCIGVRRSLIGGMTAIAIGNLVGGEAAGELSLLGARVVEGIGFLGVVLSIPSLLAASAERDKRDFIMGLWSAYMPAGITLMLVLGLLATIGWRNLWLANACIAGIFAALLAISAPAAPSGAQRGYGRSFSDVATIIREPRCLVLAFAFFAYSCQIFSMTFALPLMLTSIHGMDIGQAGMLSAAVLIVATIGHVSSGFMLRAGVPIWANIAAAFTIFALSSLVVYAAHLPLAVIVLSAALALGVGGSAPGAIYAAAPQVAPTADSVSSAIGMLQQASNLGQFAGPVILGLWVEHFGWSAAPAVVVPAALCGLAAAIAIRGLTLSPPLPAARSDISGDPCRSAATPRSRFPRRDTAP